MTQRAVSHSWASLMPETTASDLFNQGAHSTHFSSETISCTTETRSSIQLLSNNDLQRATTANFSALDTLSYKTMNPTVPKSSPFPVPNDDLPTGFMFSPFEMSGPTAKNTVDVASTFFNPSSPLIGDVTKTSESNDFEGSQQQLNGFSISSPQDMQGSVGIGEDDMGLEKNPSAVHVNNQWANIRSIGFPFSLPLNHSDAWKPNLPWDSPPCPSEMSTTYSPNNCYT